MDEIKIIRGEFDTKLELLDATVVAGFPSPAENYTHGTLDFNRDYFFMTQYHRYSNRSFSFFSKSPCITRMLDIL
jgi:hypothetical protein